MVSTGPGFVSFDVTQDKAFREGLERAIKEVSDLRPVLKSIAIDFYKSQKSIFKLKSSGGYPPFQGAKVAETWKTPGRPSMRTRDGAMTAAQNFKMKHYGFDYPLLKATGDLEEAATSPNGRGSIYKIYKDNIELGVDTNVIPYADYHQSDEPRKKIPLRKFLFIDAESNANLGDKNLQGRLPRWLGMLNTYVLRSMGVTAANAKGPKNG